MRDEVITFVLLLLLIGLFTYTSISVEKKTERVIHALQKAEEAVVSEKGGHELKKVSKKWKEEKKLLLYVCGHNIITQVDENISLGIEYLETGDKDRTIYNLKKARLLLEDLYEREKLSLDNIF